MTRSPFYWLNTDASPERDRRWCFMPGNLADDLQDFGYSGGGPAVMDDPNDAGQNSHSEFGESGQDPSKNPADGIDYKTRFADTNEARLKEKERADRLESELAQLRAHTAQTPSRATEEDVNPYEQKINQVRSDFTKNILSLKHDDPDGRQKYADTLFSAVEQVADVKVQRTEQDRQVQAQTHTEWERQSQAALKEAGLPVTEQSIQRFTEKVLGLNHTQPGWDKVMAPNDSYRHIAKLLKDEGGIMPGERKSDIDRANEEHELGAHRVLGPGSRVAPKSQRHDPNKPKEIAPRTFVEQLGDAQEARQGRAKRVYEDARR